MMRANRLTWVLVAAAGLAAPMTALGQEEQPAQEAPKSAPKSKEQQLEERLRIAESTISANSRKAAEIRIDVEFQGGTLRDYIKVLREATKPNRVNVVAPESLLNMPVGELSLQNVTVATAVQALEWAIESRGASVNEIGPNAFGVSDRRPQRVTASSSSDKIVKVMSLRDLIEPMPGDPESVRLTVHPDVVLTAIRTAVEADANEPADLKFHGDSGLLILRGKPDQVGAASNVLNELQGDLQRRRTLAKQSAPGTIDRGALEADLEKEEVRYQLTQENLSRAELELDRLTARHQAGFASAEEVASARGAIDKAKADLALTRIDRGVAKAKLDSAFKRSGGGVVIPAGKSVIIYDIAFIDDNKQAAVEDAIKALAETMDDKDLRMSRASDTLVVTARQDVHKVINDILRSMASARGATSSQPKVQESQAGEGASPQR